MTLLKDLNNIDYKFSKSSIDCLETYGGIDNEYFSNSKIFIFIDKQLGIILKSDNVISTVVFKNNHRVLLTIKNRFNSEKCLLQGEIFLGNKYSFEQKTNIIKDLILFFNNNVVEKVCE